LGFVKMQKPNETLERCELVEHLKEDILAWLPLDCLCRSRLVCKQWNTLVSSTRFITTKWAEAPPNRMPWLVVHNGKPKMPSGFVYSFFTRAWKKTSCVSVSFLLQDHEKVDSVHCEGSTAGLFLVNTFSVSRIPNGISISSDFIVCNPLTRAAKRLPHMTSIFSPSARGIMCDTQETYKVVTVGQPCPLGPEIVEIYDSNEKSWRIVGQVQKDVRVRDMRMVFCSGSFYCLTDISGGRGIMGFSIREGTFVYAPLPEIADKEMKYHLLVYGLRILVAGVLVEGGQPIEEVFIWEFEKKEEVVSSSPSSSWKEIARMPLSMCKVLNRTFPGSWGLFFRCIGVGDYALIVYQAVDVEEGDVLEMLVYSFSQNSWSLLPSCPLDKDTAAAIHDGRIDGSGNVMAFEPRPDMKVE